MEMFLGFRVRGIPKEHGAGFVSDVFELKQAAIECAQRLAMAGWSAVECHRVIDFDGEQEFDLVWPSSTPDLSSLFRN